VSLQVATTVHRPGDNWRELGAAMWNELGYECQKDDKVRPAPYTSRSDVMLKGVHRSDRNLDVLNLAWATRIKEIPDSVKAAPVHLKFDLLKRGFFVNHSQQNAHKPWGKFSTITSSAHVYSFLLDREILPEELFLLQGHPVVSLETVPDKSRATALRTMAGEGVSVPVMAAAIYAISLTALPHIWGQ
jgi:hypothetical protein